MVSAATSSSSTPPLHVLQQPIKKSGTLQTTKKKKKMEACLFLGMVPIGVLTGLYLLVVTAMMMTMFESHPPHQSLLRNPANDISYNNTKNAVPQHEHQQNKNAAHPRIPSRQMELLSTMQQGCVATADVVGNLGPPSTVLADADDNTDWLKHRWQTASNMHGTAIPGTHWLRLTWPHVVELHSVVLHWETAFADRYAIQIWDDGNSSSSSNNNRWTTVLEAPKDIVQTTKSGHSPGVPATVQDAPLHVIQTLSNFQQGRPPTTTSLRILMDHPGVHKGWGLSLWEVQVFGRRLEGALVPPVETTN